MMGTTPSGVSVREMWEILRALAGFRFSSATPRADAVSVTRGAARELEARPGAHADALLVFSGSEFVKTPGALATEARELFELYAPLCHPGPPPGARGLAAPPKCFVVAHLGQSLDGRIGPPSGEPEAITGPLDVKHNHRMRALFDVCLVGAGTVCHDDPALTVRHVEGQNPVRVVLDPKRRLSAKYALFNDGLAPTLLLCRRDLCGSGERHGSAEVVGVEDDCSPPAVLAALSERGLNRVFIEGGGVTVSRFLSARCLHRLQIAVSPFILGTGRPGIELGETVRLRPRVRRFHLAEDVLFECCFDGV